MTALGYPPHITLAIYDQASEKILHSALHHVFGSRPRIRLRFARLAHFEAPRLVFWAAPERSSPLLDAHAEFHRVIGASRSREHYKPHIWIPHCTLATNVLPANAEAAKALSKEVFEPFEIDFTLADCVEFPPLQIIDEVLLSP
jgi:2'-5' RNA ligase